MKTRWLCAAACLALALGVRADDPKPAEAKDKSAPAPSMDKMGAQMIATLKATPGCLGVETAKTQSGKFVIFAWFEDKQAAMKWYYSDMHRNLMRTFFPQDKYDKPMQDVPNDGKPILAIASVTFTDKPAKGMLLPISQISIELYQPLSGGTSFNGRFAPATLKVPKLKDVSTTEDEKK
jgi:quinol monooxygenase YgiN